MKTNLQKMATSIQDDPCSSDHSISSHEETQESCPLWQFLTLLVVSAAAVAIIIVTICCCCCQNTEQNGPIMTTPKTNTASTTPRQTTSVTEQNDIMTVYHATSKTNIPSILANGFRFPTEDKGYKLGMAVYFGKNPAYCVEEAVNSLLDDSERGQPREKEIRDSLGLVEAVVDVSK